MTALFEGDFSGKAIKAEYGTDKGGKPQIRATLEITTAGEHKGVLVQYSGNFKAESIKYTKRDMLALGWGGKTIATFVEDVLADPQIVPFQVRIAEWTDPKTGKLKKWLSAGSIGYESPPLNAATSDMTKNVDSWFDGAEEPSQPQRQYAAPQQNNGYSNSTHSNAPGPDDDLPF